MPFAPNRADVTDAVQADLDSKDFEMLQAAIKATGIYGTGCAVTAQGSPDMTVAVAAGSVLSAGVSATVTSGNVTITTAHSTLPRFDLVVVSSAGVKSAVAGTAAASPVYPAIPAGSIVLAAVYVPAADTTIASGQIVDKRTDVSGWKDYVDWLMAGRLNIASGEFTFDRRLAVQTGVQVVTGNQRFVFFTANKTETISQCKTYTGGVAAATTTLARIGIYEVNADGLTLDLVASTANDTALWNATFSTFTKSFSASFTKTRGKVYAFSHIWVGTTAPQFVGFTFGSSAFAMDSPPICGNLTGRSDLVATGQTISGLGQFNHVPIGWLGA